MFQSILSLRISLSDPTKIQARSKPIINPARSLNIIGTERRKKRLSVLEIFQKVEVQPVDKTLQDGDFLIMVSDGVVDAFERGEQEDTMLRAVSGLQGTNPGEMAERLLRIALCACGGKIQDDMTVGVIGVWEA